MLLPDREHVIQLSFTGRADLVDFLLRPNGGYRVASRLSVEAVENGGVLVRTSPVNAEAQASAMLNTITEAIHAEHHPIFLGECRFIPDDVHTTCPELRRARDLAEVVTLALSKETRT